MYKDIQVHLQKELAAIQDAGLYKDERIIDSPQSSVIELIDECDFDRSKFGKKLKFQERLYSLTKSLFQNNKVETLLH